MLDQSEERCSTIPTAETVTAALASELSPVVERTLVDDSGNVTCQSLDQSHFFMAAGKLTCAFRTRKSHANRKGQAQENRRSCCGRSTRAVGTDQCASLNELARGRKSDCISSATLRDRFRTISSCARWSKLWSHQALRSAASPFWSPPACIGQTLAKSLLNWLAIHGSVRTSGLKTIMRATRPIMSTSAAPRSAARRSARPPLRRSRFAHCDWLGRAAFHGGMVRRP